MVLLNFFFLKKENLHKKKKTERKMKKAQTEMIGLVVVVILIVIGALFYVKFVVLGGKGEEKHKGELIGSIQAYNLMNAIMNIKICSNVSVRDGIVMCKNKEELCEKDACTYLNEEIDKIVKSAIYKDYSLNVSSSGWVYELGEGCKFGVTSYAYIYTVKGETYRAVFRIC